MEFSKYIDLLSQRKPGKKYWYYNTEVRESPGVAHRYLPRVFVRMSLPNRSAASACVD
jgi:hypothetical protein